MPLAGLWGHLSVYVFRSRRLRLGHQFPPRVDRAQEGSPIVKASRSAPAQKPNRAERLSVLIGIALALSCARPSTKSYEFVGDAADSNAVVLIDRDTIGVLRAWGPKGSSHLIARGARHGRMTVIERDGHSFSAQIPDSAFEYVYLVADPATGRHAILFSP